MADILRARIFAIDTCGYEDANDLDRLRFDPAFQLACVWAMPDSGLDLRRTAALLSPGKPAGPENRDALGRCAGRPVCGYRVMSRHRKTLRSTLMTRWTSFTAISSISLFNSHYDERCFLPIHFYDAATGRPVATILRPGKTPTGKEIRKSAAICAAWFGASAPAAANNPHPDPRR
jgi:Transposase DDE domain group 1